MAALIRLDDFKKGTASRSQRKFTFFNRAELMALLNMYSRRVMSGDWRDYAIDHDRHQAIFSIFRHAAEYPLFTITKTDNDRGKGKFTLRSGTEVLRRAQRIDEVISVLEKKLRLVRP